MRYLDLAIIVLYLIGITWFGARFKDSQKSLRDYFLGGRNTPWWAIGFSIVSAETSTLTVIGTPALSFYGNFGFLQVVFGYLLARIFISTLFLPQYFRGELFTAYQLMERRFGPRLRKLTAGTFLLLRALAEGVRVFAISIVVSIILGTGEVASIVLIVCLTLFYTFEGGMTAVIWTDVVQMILYVGGALVSLFVILAKIPGGWPEVWQAAGAADKLGVFDFHFEWTMKFFSAPYTFWAGFLGGCFLTTASHGTEQLMVQRLLSARNERESRLALFSSWFVILFQFTLFLVIGLILWVYYGNTGQVPPKPADRIYPQFIWNSLPIGIAGLVIAAILAAAMSNLSAALNSLASTTIMDFYRPMRPGRSESTYLRLAKWATVAWGCVLFVIGLLARSVHSVLEAGLGIASILYGALLGVFLLGVLTKRVHERAAMIGMSAGLAVNLYIKFATPVAWTWYVLIGTLVTSTTAIAASWLLREKSIDTAS
ncbi:sodium:solute symporter [uncultured Paludibaculum sp.]|uniref:sodium:solute symporter n=1 Tax=uncultured Paludibaculum sp. TaxID=1765020 RepID=UPI002AAB3BB3|nr:sodium:solute symporter [uncultured Paludibaculum sp.]